MPPQYRTDTLCLTFRTLPPIFMALRYSPKWIWFVLTTRFRWHRRIFLTAITTPFGLFEYTRMPYGLRNAAQTFQRFMDSVLRGLPFCWAYLDDLLIASSSPEQHKSHLQAVFTRLQEFG